MRAAQLETAAQNGAALDGESFIRPHLRELAAYTPIEPFEVLSAKLGMRTEDIVKLDANENPYGPPPEVLKALGSLKFPHIYPDPESRQLRATLARDHSVSMDKILVGCGADELIDLLMRCCLDPGDAILDCPPTFTMYAFDAAVNNARVISVPRKDDFQLDMPALLEAAREQKPRMIFVTSPNNPDGSLVPDEDLQALLQLPALIVLDEAYIEFADHPSRAGWVGKHSNLVVLRTFSKSAGLAGIRVGWGCFPPELITYMWRAKQPYNVSVVSEVAACTALSCQEYLKEKRDLLVQERQRMTAQLREIPFLEPYPSASNFVLCKVVGRDAKGVKDALAKQGIMVRHYAKPELSGFIRISAGRPDQTDLLMKALQAL
ncbi:hypothetical protein WJX84_011215 [Apatococcus fuscideae]|uniref:histidinol-phosphate transaminase n=1 Tax=Apatococcus fuscideae TaxID=2026836 RepID=A0AAW1T1N3_9CHLO